MKNQTLLTTLATMASSLALVACGGGGGFEAPPAPPPVNANEVPASATASIPAFVNYLDTLRASEGSEPLGLDAANPPSSDTVEPLAVTAA